MSKLRIRMRPKSDIEPNGKAVSESAPLPPLAKRDHRYIVVREDSTIETLVCRRTPPEQKDERYRDRSAPAPGTIGQHLHALHLNGYHMLPNGVMIWWRDAGSMDGSKRNAPVSNYLGFTCYGPCVFSKSTTYTDGLSDEQYTAIMNGLKSSASPDFAGIVDTHLSRLKPH